MAEVPFNPLVHALGLSICTRVECGAEVLLDVCGSADGSAEVTGEPWISIGDDAFGDPKQGEEVAKIKQCYALSI